MIRAVLLVLMCISLTSCLEVFRPNYYKEEVVPFLESLEEDYKPQVVDGVMEPAKIPDLDEDQETLLGIDSNNDGVRDDVEIFINRKFKYDYERETEKRFFRHAQIYLKNAKSMTKEQLKKELNQFHADDECRRYYVGKMDLPKTEGMFGFDSFGVAFNTKSRKEYSWLMDDALRAGDEVTSGVGTYDQAFEQCSDYVKRKYPNISK